MKNLSKDVSNDDSILSQPNYEADIDNIVSDDAKNILDYVKGTSNQDTDYSDVINDCLNRFNTILIPEGSYAIKKPVIMPKNRSIIMRYSTRLNIYSSAKIEMHSDCSIIGGNIQGAQLSNNPLVEIAYDRSREGGDSLNNAKIIGTYFYRKNDRNNVYKDGCLSNFKTQNWIHI